MMMLPVSSPPYQPVKPYVWLQTEDGSIQEVEQDVAMGCPFICLDILHKGLGSSRNLPILLPPRVNSTLLNMILEYCRFHQVPGRSNKERKTFDEKFIRLDTKKLCELTSAADSLQVRPLVDLTSRALARMIEGKTPEEIRETFHLPDDLTEEEKLEPLKNTMDDPRIRLLNRLYARKRKELQERTKLKNVEVVDGHTDDRSVEDLLKFINGGNEDSKRSKGGRCKRKKNRRKKEHLKDQMLDSSVGNCTKEALCAENDSRNIDTLSSACILNNVDGVSGEQEASDDRLSFGGDFDAADNDDGLDPILKEKLDREVEDFARRLNSDWSGRMQEILASSQGQGSAIPPPLNDDPSLNRLQD